MKRKKNSTNYDINSNIKERKKTKKRYKLKWRNLIILLIITGLIITLIISLCKIISWKSESFKSKKEINEINDIVEVIEVTSNENTEIIENDVSKSDPYWDYIKMNMINVDFKELKKENSDTKGWIKVNGTNINYPFVQTTNNEYYLKHSFNKSYNSGGWIFMDYRNNLENLEKNTIIYGHSRLDTTMFGSLKNILNNGWLDNKNNYIIKLSDEYQNTLWQVFSVYHLPATSDYLRVKFFSDADFYEFSNMLLNRSVYNFNTTVDENDKILTLSTCYKNDERLALHAKLIKIEKKSQ